MAATVIKRGMPVTFAVVPGENGAPEEAVSVSLAVADGNGLLTWMGTNPVLWADALVDGVTFPSEASIIDGDQAWRMYGLVFNMASGQPVRVTNEVIIEHGAALIPLRNSFANYGELALVARTISNATGMKCCSVGDSSNLGPFGDGNPTLVAAYINAFHNIGYVSVDFFPPRHRARWRDQSRMWDGDGIFDPDTAKVKSTRQLTPELWEELEPWQREALIRAQVIEANYLLSGNTVEKQRYSGLLSHSAGESAHFYRSSKPFEAPICKEAMKALKGIVSYVTRIGG